MPGLYVRVPLAFSYLRITKTPQIFTLIAYNKSICVHIWVYIFV